MTTVIYGQKIEMGEAFIGETRYGVTKIQLMPMTVSQIKSIEKDGYQAVQVAFGTPKKHTNKALTGHLKAAGAKASTVEELPFEDGLAVGTVLNPKDIIAVGAICNVQGISKGKGFAGVVKRWNFAGGPRTHGQSDRLRAPGSIGQGTTPGRVHKGKHMAGHMGTDTVTVKGAMVVSFDETDNTIWVTGPVPGHRHTTLRLSVSGHKDIAPVTYLHGRVESKEEPVVAPTQTVTELVTEEVKA